MTSMGDIFLSFSKIAMATSSGALPKPATQWTAIVASEVSELFFGKNSETNFSQVTMTSFGGFSPSSNGMSFRKMLKMFFFYKNLNSQLFNGLCIIITFTCSY
jgi:hypothetical protein